MGTWYLEIVKMAIYIFIPVGAFYGYHQVNYFDEKLRQYARKTISPSTLENQKLLDEAKEIVRRSNELHRKEQLDKLERKQMGDSQNQ